MESRLIEITKKAGRANTTNNNEPDAKGLPEPDVADMEFFLEQIEVVLPVVGFDFLRPQPSAETDRTRSSHGIKLSLSSVSANAQASAVYIDGEVTVLKGSKAGVNQYAVNIYGGLRQQLIDEKRLLRSDAGEAYVFDQDVTFDSPSAASSVILNRNSNGRTEWKIPDGRTLKEWQDEQLQGIATE